MIVDADTGFGDAVNVERTIDRAGSRRRRRHSARRPGAAQALRPSVGQVAGRAGRDVRQAARPPRPRSDHEPGACWRGPMPAASTSLDDAIERAKRYLDAGADWIFPEALADAEEFEQVCQGDRGAAGGQHDRVRQEPAARRSTSWPRWAMPRCSTR